MNIAAVTPCSLLDFPHTLSCILFTQGCNFRCGYCHNPEMVLPQKASSSLIPWETVLHFLERRRGLLEGVVFCGGEPTLQPDLLEALAQVRSLGFRTKLDTNGSRPDILQKALLQGLVDYVAMDYKTAPERAEGLYKGGRFHNAVQASLKLLIKNDVRYEIRTTVLREYHDMNTMRQMATDLTGASTWYLQPFRSDCTLDPAMAACSSYSPGEMATISNALAEICRLPVLVRG